MVHLITGYKGEEHIQSKDARSFNAAMFGAGQFVMEIGNQVEASIINNSTVRVLDGDILMQGGHIRIDTDTYEDLTITTGTAGKDRIDLIVMTYEKDPSDGTEKAVLEVIKGTEVDGTAQDPEYVIGNIAAGDLKNQMPLYRVHVEGVVLKELDTLFTTIPTYKTLAEEAVAKFHEEAVALINPLDTLEEIMANTEGGKIAGALALKEVNSQLNNSLSDIDLRVNPETGKPEWKQRGADTFNPFSSGEEPTLLWTLPSGTTWLSGNLSVNLTDYDYVLIEAIIYVGDTKTTTTILKKDGIISSFGAMNSSGTETSSRIASASNSGLWLGTSLFGTKGSEKVSNANYCLPYKIWGVKSIPFVKTNLEDLFDVTNWVYQGFDMPSSRTSHSFSKPIIAPSDEFVAFCFFRLDTPSTLRTFNFTATGATIKKSSQYFEFSTNGMNDRNEKMAYLVLKATKGASVTLKADFTVSSGNHGVCGIGFINA